MTDHIHPTATVSEEAEVPEDVQVGPYTLIHGNVRVGVGSVIESHCVLGHPSPTPNSGALVLGPGALIRSHSVFYEGSTFGEGLTTGHRVTVREGIQAGSGLQIGTLCDFQGHATIGDHVRTHSNVHIGQKSIIGSYVWIFPYVVLTNDPHPPSDGFLAGVTVEDYVVLATMCTILPGLNIGTRSVVAAHALVTKNVLPDTLVAGVPARSMGLASRVMLGDDSGPAYPWMHHFHRGYPSAVVQRWLKEYP